MKQNEENIVSTMLKSNSTKYINVSVIKLTKCPLEHKSSLYNLHKMATRFIVSLCEMKINDYKYVYIRMI